jgi:guanylate kinase
VLLDIDTRGAANIRECGDPMILRALADIFIMLPDLEELRRRLLRRGTETEEQVEIRLRNAAVETERWRDYRYVIISGSMEENIVNFRAIMRAERQLTARMSMQEEPAR